MMPAIEIEIDTPRNAALFFAPLQRSIRGRFDLARIGTSEAVVAAQSWPAPIPSQRLGIDPDGCGYLSEPLHLPEHTVTRERIEKKLGMSLEPATQTFPGIHLPSWLFWLKRAVEDGLARVVRGQLPDDVGGKPRLDFINAEPGPTNTDRLASALEAQTAAFRDLTSAILKSLEKK